MSTSAYRTYTSTQSPKGPTPQDRPIVGREAEMVENSAGGYTFEVTPWTRLDRFLILGSDSNTYYASSRALTEDNAKSIIALIKNDGVRVVRRIVEISDSGRAPKNDPALFALALCMTYGDEATKQEAYGSVSKVARIGTHILHLAEYVNGLRGWGRGVRRAFGNWYLGQSLKGLSTNLVKYANRDGWTHQDVLRLSHPRAEGDYAQLLGYAVGKPYEISDEATREFMAAVNQLKGTTSAEEAISLISKYKLPREVVPTELLTKAKVWETLLPHMGTTALIRNLPTLTRLGLIASVGAHTNEIADRLVNSEELTKARIHPISVLVAMHTYRSGKSVRGNTTWIPVYKIINALDEAFYAAFGNIVPTGKNILFGLDVSGSMSSGGIMGIPSLTPRDISGALAMVAARTEKNAAFIGFTSGAGYRDTGITVLDITPKHRLDTILSNISGLSFGGTDCALPMLWASQKGYEFDAFVIITDNETWAGDIHPSQALNKYRREFNPSAKLIVSGLTATNFTIADPQDAGQMDVVGFDTATPQIMSDFIRG